MSRWTLSQRLSVVFAVLLLACCGASAWLQMRASARHAQEVVQRLSGSLAAHIAGNPALIAAGGLNAAAVEGLFSKLMDVNPSVEVYLLDQDGGILAQAAPPGHLRRMRVDLAPIRRLLAGEPLPIFGDDPRATAGEGGRKVFSAAPLRVDGTDAGYVYVVLLGETHDALAQVVDNDNVLRNTLMAMAVVAGLGLAAGLAAFRWITRPLRQLTVDIRRFEADGVAAVSPPQDAPGAPSGSRDEITLLRQAFAQMTRRIGEQWRQLTLQDQQRRELVANISHDLRTPLTSLHGYLETLRLKADTLSEAERLRYLDIALGQSRNVGRLAQSLFELARLEYGVVKPEKERFFLADLVQDVFQKFELAAEARRQRLVAEIAPDLPAVAADVAMIERVLTNLLDNAIRHTPVGGDIVLRLQREGGAIGVEISDSGPGIPEQLKQTLFTRPAFPNGGRAAAGGLGLVIVRRILQLHDSDIQLAQGSGRGAVFRFALNLAADARAAGFTDS
jgi:signal transduction histidine kinase